MKLKTTLAVVGLSLVSYALLAGPVGRGKYETPKYETVAKDGAFEIRDYPSLVVAETSMDQKRRGQNSAFMTLFRYISGGNENQQKIAMTTPVFATMGNDRESMSFVVPSDVVQGGVPEATNSAVAIKTRAAGRFAVYRYSGRWTAAREAKARAKLVAWIKERKLATIGDFEKASYDPPFTPPPLRRNEVLVRIKN